MSFPVLKIGDVTARIPIVQGGMGVGISLSGLASAVANEGGIGVIAGAMIGMNEPNRCKDPVGADNTALRREIREARAKTEGLLGVNLMVALSNFSQLVQTSLEEKIDIIFSGAGLPLDLPKLWRETCEATQEELRTKLAPIVSSARAASLIGRKWMSRFNYVPDAFVLEGPKAGGHLGFKPEEINDPGHDLEHVLPEVLEAVKPMEDAAGRAIPVIAAGGIFSGFDIRKFLNMGASGVQLGTRFVATHECDADIRFKEAFVNAKEEDVTIIKSPVGMPGRAINNAFLDSVAQGLRKPFKCLFQCIKSCEVENSPYCIAAALLNAKRGNLDRGFAFTGINAHLINSIESVKDIISSLQKEFDEAMSKFSWTIPGFGVQKSEGEKE